MFYWVEYNDKKRNENNLFHLFYKTNFEKCGSMISYLVILGFFFGFKKGREHILCNFHVLLSKERIYTENDIFILDETKFKKQRHR